MSGQPDGLAPVGLVLTASATVTRADGSTAEAEPGAEVGDERAGALGEADG